MTRRLLRLKWEGELEGAQRADEEAAREAALQALLADDCKHEEGDAAAKVSSWAGAGAVLDEAVAVLSVLQSAGSWAWRACQAPGGGRGGGEASAGLACCLGIHHICASRRCCCCCRPSRSGSGRRRRPRRQLSWRASRSSSSRQQKRELAGWQPRSFCCQMRSRSARRTCTVAIGR